MTTVGTDFSSGHSARGNANLVILSGRDASDTARLLKLLSNPEIDIAAGTAGGRLAGPVASIDAGGPTKSSPSLSAAKQVLIARRVRGQFLDEALFSEPGWDMLLALYIGEESEARSSISRLTDYSGAASSTALRWIGILEEMKLVRRISHPTDLRTGFVELTAEARRMLDAYFARIDAMGLTAPQR